LEDEFLFDEYEFKEEMRKPDPKGIKARKELEGLFDRSKEEVFFSRQLEVWFEDKYYHWVTNRVIREIIASGHMLTEERNLKTGGWIHLLWHKNYRYYKRSAAKTVKIVEEYADPNIAGAIGLHGEMMVLEAFARSQFVLMGKNTKSYKEKEWKRTNHDLDFIFERDGQSYGVEVKNTLGYMEHEELLTKIEMCAFLGLRPLFVTRMLPKSWIYEINEKGGFALIMKYQLYPWTHKKLAEKVAKMLNLPVDAPKVIEEGTIKRFLDWHRKNVKSKKNSQKTK